MKLFILVILDGVACMSYFYDNKIPIKYLNKIENKHNREESDNKINEEKYEKINNYNGFEIINKDNSSSISNFIAVFFIYKGNGISKFTGSYIFYYKLNIYNYI